MCRCARLHPPPPPPPQLTTSFSDVQITTRDTYVKDRMTSHSKEHSQSDSQSTTQTQCADALGYNSNDNDVGLNVLGCRADILRTSRLRRRTRRRRRIDSSYIYIQLKSFCSRNLGACGTHHSRIHTHYIQTHYLGICARTNSLPWLVKRPV